jgi:arginase
MRRYDDIALVSVQMDLGAGRRGVDMGPSAAVADHYHARGERLGLIWVDAHGDLNTPETTPSGNIHGMSLAVLTGEGHPALTELAGRSPSFSPENVCILGARELDAGERERIRARGVRVFTMTEVDERGLAVCMDEALQLVTKGTAGFHMSFDLDCVDPMKAARSGMLVGLEIVELNPVLDTSNRTAQLAVGLTASALGKTIL